MQVDLQELITSNLSVGDCSVRPRNVPSPKRSQCQRFISAPPATIDHFIDKHHRVWTHALTKIAREHIGSFVDDFFLLLLVEETLWELKICKWHCDSPFGVCARYVWTEAFWLRNASAAQPSRPTLTANR